MKFLSKYGKKAKEKKAPAREDSHTVYHRIGALVAESLGLAEEKKPLKTKFETKPGKPDKMAPSSERKEFGKLVGKRSKAQHRKTVTGFVKKYGNDRPVVPGRPSTNKFPVDIDDHTEYKRMGMLMAEAVTKKVGPIASQYSGMGRVKSKKKGEGAQSIGDPVVRKAVRGANKRVGEKLGVKANLETDVAAQQGLENRRRKFRRKGIGLPAMTQKERQADARQDVERRKGPDDK